MLVVAFETSSSVGSVAAAREGLLVEERLFTKGLHHGANIVPTLEAIFEAQSLRREDVGLVCVSVGPGSYTGVRVGIASAKALAFALGVPLIGVPAPDAIVRNLDPEGKLKTQNSKLKAGAPFHLSSEFRVLSFAAVVIDARRGQFYVTPYEARGGQWVRTAEHRSLDPAAAVVAIPSDAVLVGEGAKAFIDLTKGAWRVAPDDAGIPRARFTALLGGERFRAGAPDELLTVEPLYLRPIEAEETWRKRHTP